MRGILFTIVSVLCIVFGMLTFGQNDGIRIKNITAYPVTMGKDIGQFEDTKGTSWSRLELPPPVRTDDDEAIRFKTVDQSVRVWANGRVLYEYGDMGTDAAMRGDRWHYVPIPKWYRSSEILLETSSAEDGEAGSVSYLSYGLALEQYNRLLLYDLPNLMMIPVGLVVGYVLLMNGFYRRMKHFYLNISIYALIFSLWAFSTTHIKDLFWDAPYFWTMLRSISEFAMATVTTSYIYILVEKRFKACIKFFIFFYWTLLSFGFLGEVTKFFTLQTLSAYVLPEFLLLISPLVLYMLYVSGKDGKNPYAEHMVLPYLYFTLLRLGDGILRIHPGVVAWDFHFVTFAILGLLPYMRFLVAYEARKTDYYLGRVATLQNEVSVTKERMETDVLTGCYNRYRLEETYKEFTELACKLGESVGLIMFDIDYFKRINDECGHDEGDAVLKNLSALVRERLDRRHCFFRWGGEEFLIFGLHYDLQGMADFAEELRVAVKEAQLCKRRSVTCSFGVAEWREDDTMDSFIKRVDEALYTAKNAGRNRVVKAGVPTLCEAGKAE